MSSAAPALIVNCEVIELHPAVYDAQGVMVRPPVLQPPQEYVAPLDANYVVNANGNMLSYAQAGLPGPPETLAQWTARQQQAATDASVAAATAEAKALVELRMIRDRWLALTDFVESFLNVPASFAHLPLPIQQAITTNSAGWVAWRQALRDLPAKIGAPGTPTVSALTAVQAASRVHSTTDTFPAPWPQPPAAPAIHLT